MLLIATLVSGAAPITVHADGTAPAADSYLHRIESWHARRVERLRAPDGWLSLIGLPWLKEGANTVGSAADNDIVIAKAPARLGTVTLADGRATIALDAASGATIDGAAARRADLLDDSHERPTTIAFGTVSFYLIDRNGRKGLRIKDSEADTRRHFLGIDSYPVDPSWRVEAQWVPYDSPHTLEIPNVLGQIDRMPVPGKAVFERDGKRYELLPVLEDPQADAVWFIFADATTGTQTYGGGRFLYADLPRDGRLVIDFNKAYNPPCAFTAYATCPLAPPENRLKLAVTAGEKKYRGGPHH
jgi:uncharacterized protein (DUF1684 family)